MIELLIAISVASIITGVIVLMLNTGFDSYLFAEKGILLEKVLDEALSEIANGGFETYGIKDALEIVEVTPTSITFVPLWMDDTHSLGEKPFVLNRFHKAGTALPIAEVSTAFSRRSEKQRWKEAPIIFFPGSHEDPLEPDDRVLLEVPEGKTGKVRFIYHPDALYHPDCAMTIKWEKNKITRTYGGRTQEIPRYEVPGVSVSDLKFEYYDNTNTPVAPKSGLIPNITAVRIKLSVSRNGKHDRETSSMEGFTFVNLRNTRTGGKGILIQEGTRIRIPNSGDIRIFGISNIAGFTDGDMIELEARPETGNAWKVGLELGFDPRTNEPVIEKYSIEYPPGRVVDSDTIRLTTETTLSFMTLGYGTRFDYDFDKNADNVVNLKGNVELVVTRMDANGAQLFIRP